MAIAIVEELWGRIRAHIDDKITAATAASESAVAAKTAAEAAATEVQETAANAAAVAAANVATELQDLTDRAETAATTATTAVATEVEKLKGAAPEAFDTLGEIAAELAANETERSALTNSIAAKADKVHDHTVEQVTGLQGELDGKAPVTHDHTAAQISDATTVGRSVLTAASTAAARQAIGAGTSNLALGTTSSTAAAGNHTHTVNQVTGLQSALDGKANTGDVPVVDDGYNSRYASDPATDFPAGVSYGLQGSDRGWAAAIQADTGYANFGGFAMVQTLRHGRYSPSTTQLVFTYDNTHKPVFMRKWYGSEEGWGPFRSLTDDGHTHTSANITDAVYRVGTSDTANKVIATSGTGRLYYDRPPGTSDEIANKQYVDSRTPETRVVSSLPASPSAGVVYLVTG